MRCIYGASQFNLSEVVQISAELHYIYREEYLHFKLTEALLYCMHVKIPANLNYRVPRQKSHL
jgi:hypothetical protein